MMRGGMMKSGHMDMRKRWLVLQVSIRKLVSGIGQELY